MVFQSLVHFARSRGPDEFWRKRKIFKLASHFRGRSRNCYSNAVRAVHRSLQFATKGRDPKREWIQEIWKTRINAGCREHGADYYGFKEGLTRCEIHLDRKSLAELAVWEPRSFKSLIHIACARLKQDGLQIINNMPANNLPVNTITKGLIK